MKSTLLSLALSLISFVSVGQSIQNASLSCTKSSRCIGPDNWRIEGVTATSFYQSNTIASLFPGSEPTDVFFGYFSNGIDQWGGFSQIIEDLEANKEYCLSFEANVNRPWKPATTIDFELYLDSKLYDSETFVFPSDSSKIVDLCFESPTYIDSKKLLLRTNNLIGLTTYVIIKAGSGNFYESQTTSSRYENFINDISISPNPTTGNLSIQLEENSSDYRITVYSASGIKKFEDIKYTSTNIDISFLESGFYYLEIMNENKRMIKKIVLTN